MKEEITIENIKDPKSFGLALKRIRKMKSISQKDLAELMNMRQPTISDVEGGRGTLESAFKIIQALKLNLALSTSKKITSKKQDSTISKMLDIFED